MAPTVQTRRAAALEEQLKLKNALLEIKSLKQLNDQLLKEQEDSEVELRAIIAKNSQLKAELASLNNAHMLVSQERDQLQQAVSSFNQCIETYDEALSKISMLEDELSRAQKTIDDLQSQLDSFECRTTSNLYDELLASSSTVPVTIDLTCDSPCTAGTKFIQKQDPIHLNSHNKIKKYIKIGKIIKKTKHLIKTQKAHSRNIILKKKRSHLLNNLDAYCVSLKELREKYDEDVQNLNNEILKLKDSLQNVTKQYELSQSQIHEHIQAADELVALGTYNLARFDSFTNKCQCSHSVPVGSQDSLLPVKLGTYPKQCGSNVTSNTDFPSYRDENLSARPSKHIIISDSLGRGFGSMMSYHLEHSVINKCSPGVSFDTLINSLNSENLDSNTSVTILFGDSLNVKKRTL